MGTSDPNRWGADMRTRSIEPSYARRALVVLGAVLVILGLSTMPAIAGRPRPGSTGLSDGQLVKQSPVEQQSPGYLQWQSTGDPAYYTPDSWVSNPTGCVWDVDDDQVRYTTGGSLGAGASLVDQICLNADWSGMDWTGHLAGITLSSKSSSLSVTISFSPGGSFSVRPVWNNASKTYGYKGCTGTPAYTEGDPALQPIAGSNGGVAVPTTVKLTITNTGSRSADIAMQWKVGNYYTASTYC